MLLPSSRSFLVAAFAAVSASLACTPPSANAQRRYRDRVHETFLENGLKVLLLEDHKAPVAVVQLWYRVGSRNEVPGKTGLAHVLEHMMFKGTPKFGPEEYSRIIQRNGGNENAFTTADATAYFATLASDRIEVELELEADRMRNLAFAEEQFTPELAVIQEERRMRVDNSPASALIEQLRSAAFLAHPYQWPVIGWMTDLDQATRSDALEFYRTYYQPNNAVLIVAGDFETKAMLKTIRKHFDRIPPGPYPPIVRAIEPMQEGERRVTLRRPAELPWIGMAYHVPRVGHADAYALELTAAILAGGKSGRLYEDLVYDRRIARDAAADYDLISSDPGLFWFYAQPMPGQSVSRLETALDRHVRRLQESEPTQQELERARTGLETGFVMAQDSLFYQAMLLGQYETAGGWNQLDAYLSGLASVTPADIQRVANTYLTPTNRTVGILEPISVQGEGARR